SMLERGKFVVTLGGEHTISQAPIAACAEHFGEISVLQFDAHTDLREAYLGDPFSHASVMARVKEQESVRNIVAVGIRAMDRSEFTLADRRDIFFDHELQGSDDWPERVIARLGEQVY